jgi:diadenosine tetraphosphatase ApaH/serine/threonine PP2A family protein phosphatase
LLVFLAFVSLEREKIMFSHDPQWLRWPLDVFAMSQVGQQLWRAGDLRLYFPDGFKHWSELKPGAKGWTGPGLWHRYTHHVLVAVQGQMHVQLAWMDDNGDSWHSRPVVCVGGPALLVPAQVWYEIISTDTTSVMKVCASRLDVDDAVGSPPDGYKLSCSHELEMDTRDVA